MILPPHLAAFFAEIDGADPVALMKGAGSNSKLSITASAMEISPTADLTTINGATQIRRKVWQKARKVEAIPNRNTISASVPALLFSGKDDGFGEAVIDIEAPSENHHQLNGVCDQIPEHKHETYMDDLAADTAFEASLVPENAHVLPIPLEATVIINEDNEAKRVQQNVIALMGCILAVVAIAIGLPLGLNNRASSTV